MVTQNVDGVTRNSPVWLMNGAAGAATAWALKDPTERQLRLNPTTTDVYPGGAVPSQVVTVAIGDATAILQGRGWGEVAAMSYHSYLIWLENALNGKGRIDGWRNLQGEPAFAKVISDGFKFQQVNKEDIGHGADMRFPVYACGYNWLQSNAESAKRLAQRIDDVINANNTKSFTCEKIILITHSMGGLVARYCSEVEGQSGKIAGILHGVMPATGAAVAYKRVRAGTEGSAGTFVIGGTAEKMTPVFANAPGALQLLPSQHYPPGWLKLGVGRSGGFKEVASLPATDPYTEIYEKKGKWWSLVRETLINPAELDGHKGWGDYLKNIRVAKAFHTDLGTKYHKNTISFFGDGKAPDNGMTWGTVRWEAIVGNDRQTPDAMMASVQALASPPKDEFLAMPTTSDNGEGTVNALNKSGYRYSFAISTKDSKGDGTVPVVSGVAPALAGSAAGVQASYHVNVDAEGHEGAFRVPQAQQLSLHAVLSLARAIPKVTA
jgi:PGAP1-like protein